MNKFDFILENKIVSKDYKVKEELFLEFKRNFKFSFSSVKINFINDEVEKTDLQNFLDRNTHLFSTRIVKSEITENVLEQIKQMFEIIKESRQELCYLKMNFNTKMKFRMYWSYEIDRILYNKVQFEKVSGNLMGIPIIIDEKIETNIVRPIIIRVRKNNKILSIIKN